MIRKETFISFALVVTAACVFLASASPSLLAQRVSQAVVTPGDPIWATGQDGQDPPEPPEPSEPAPNGPAPNGNGEDTPTPAAAAGPGRGGGQAQPRPYNQVITSEARTDEGIFTVHRIGDRIFYEIPQAELNKDFLWVSQIKRTTIGAGYGGQAAGDRVVRWELLGNRVLLRLIDYSLIADPETPIALAVASANNPAIARTFNVAAFSPAGDPVIDVTQLFLTEIPELSVRGRIGARGFDQNRTFLERVVSFPENINVEVHQTYTAPADTGDGGGRGRGGMRGSSATIVMSYSMVKLPEQPMMPRLFDERVGYFTRSMYDFSRDEHRAPERTFITRYRLDKQDPDAEISEPVKPIVYYLDPATPPQWVSYVKQGIEDWQPAFERAGFRNAIVAREAPADDPDWSPEDARHSVVRWLPSTVENASGPHIHDPRSGEILVADIQLYHNVQNLAKNWYFVQVAPLDPRARRLPLPDDLMGELIRYVVSHEVGHTLGFQHNMKASAMYSVEQVRDREWVRQHGHVPSIMDYARFNYVAQPEDGIDPADLIPKVGPYDIWATMWGYRPIPGARTPDEEKPTLDEWARQQDETPWYRFSTPRAGTSDPTDLTEAVGDADPVLATTLGLRNLERVAGMLLDATSTRPGEPYTELTEVYGRVVSQWTLEMNHVTQVVGGVTSQQKHIGQEGVRFTPVPRERQAEAVAFLLTHAFATPTFLVEPELLRRMEASGVVARIRNAQNSVMNSLLQASRLDRLVEQAALDGAAAYAPLEFLADVRRGIWRELDSHPPQIDTFRRNTQRVYLDTIDNRLNGANPSAEVRALLRGELRDVREQILAALPAMTDRASRLHLEDARDLIDQILDPRAMRGAPAGGRGGGAGLTAADAPVAGDWTFDYDNDPFLQSPDICWPDYAI